MQRPPVTGVFQCLDLGHQQICGNVLERKHKKTIYTAIGKYNLYIFGANIIISIDYIIHYTYCFYFRIALLLNHFIYKHSLSRIQLIKINAHVYRYWVQLPIITITSTLNLKHFDIPFYRFVLLVRDPAC